jgi:hypothetical protein
MKVETEVRETDGRGGEVVLFIFDVFKVVYPKSALLKHDDDGDY